jgi:hypothetical protein
MKTSKGTEFLQHSITVKEGLVVKTVVNIARMGTTKKQIRLNK